MKEYFKIENLKRIIYFAKPYAFIIALFYLYAFWNSFDINFLEYIAISDFLKLAFYPLVGTIIALAITNVGTGLFLCDSNYLKALTSCRQQSFLHAPPLD